MANTRNNRKQRNKRRAAQSAARQHAKPQAPAPTPPRPAPAPAPTSAPVPAPHQHMSPPAAPAASQPITIATLFEDELRKEHSKNLAEIAAWDECAEKTGTAGLAAYRFEQVLVEKKLKQLRDDEDKLKKLISELIG